MIVWCDWVYVSWFYGCDCVMWVCFCRLLVVSVWLVCLCFSCLCCWIGWWWSSRLWWIWVYLVWVLYVLVCWESCCWMKCWRFCFVVFCVGMVVVCVCLGCGSWVVGIVLFGGGMCWVWCLGCVVGWLVVVVGGFGDILGLDSVGCV